MMIINEALKTNVFDLIAECAQASEQGVTVAKDFLGNRIDLDKRGEFLSRWLAYLAVNDKVDAEFENCSLYAPGAQCRISFAPGTNPDDAFNICDFAMFLIFVSGGGTVSGGCTVVDRALESGFEELLDFSECGDDLIYLCARFSYLESGVSNEVITASRHLVFDMLDVIRGKLKVSPDKWVNGVWRGEVRV